MGKGDHRRPSKISHAEFIKQWEAIFGPDSAGSKGNPGEDPGTGEDYIPSENKGVEGAEAGESS